MSPEFHPSTEHLRPAHWSVDHDTAPRLMVVEVHPVTRATTAYVPLDAMRFAATRRWSNSLSGAPHESARAVMVTEDGVLEADA